MKEVKMFLLFLAIVVSATQFTIFGQTVTVNGSAPISDGGNYNLCQNPGTPTVINLVASMAGAAWYFWPDLSMPEQTMQNPTITITNTTALELYFYDAGLVETHISFTITYNALPVVNALPTPITGCNGVVKNLKATNSALPVNYTYQWEVSTDGGGTWGNLVDDGAHVGSTNFQLDITLNVGLVARQYRCKLTNTTTTCSATTNSSTIGALSAPPTLTLVGGSTATNVDLNCPANVGLFTLTPSGGTAPYTIEMMNNTSYLVAPNNNPTVVGVGAGGNALFNVQLSAVGAVPFQIKVTDANGCSN
jgi:hypothetical protein